MIIGALCQELGTKTKYLFHSITELNPAAMRIS